MGKNPDNANPGTPETAEQGTLKGTTADCYSAGERKAMERYQELRGVWLAPLLGWATRLRITPDHLSAVSLFLGLLFCVVYFWSPAAAFTLLTLHLVMDALDGPLARHQKVASRAGSFTDSLCDQIVVTASTIVLMPEPAGIWPGVVYVFLYTLVVVFAMVRNAMAIPYSWLFRPRLLVYAAAAIEILFLRETALSGTLNYVLWGANVLLAVNLLTGFRKLRRQLKPRVPS